MNARTLAGILTLCLGLPACDDDDSKKDDDNNNDNGNPPSGWLVGDDGEMLRITAETEAASYDLDEDHDLRAITCVGHETAWVVGENGTVIVSRDAGQTWRSVDVGVEADFVAIAASELDEGNEEVWAVGNGVILYSDDGGNAWSQLDAPALAWTAVATDAFGESTIAAASDGSLWQIGDGDPSLVRAGDGALASVAITPDGDHAAAVGAGGLVLVSHDAALTWDAVDVPTARDLHAVRVAAAGDLVIAAGDAGVVVRVDDEGAEAEEHLDSALALRGLHLHADGGGHAVGDAGTVLVTEDAGQSWERLDVGSRRTLRGVDDFHVGSHL